MVYHLIALNTPFGNGLLTYGHPSALAEGMRVSVRFNRRLVAGVVWRADVAAAVAADKVLPIEAVWTDVCLPENWRQLLDFTARYYHYPLGQAVAAALPAGLKAAKAVALPEPLRCFALSEAGQAQPLPPLRHHKQRALWLALAEGGLDKAALKEIHAGAEALLAQWQAAGWITVSAAPAPRLLPSVHVLNAEQAAAADAVGAALGRFQPFLLHGVTGSGKTEVYFDVMARVLAAGRQVLFLLPEINLTPQLLQRVSARFGEVPTAVLHSRAAAGARTRDYLRALSGQAKLVIGTRLSVFAPLPDVGLIVVDEEHDASFKQDNELRYHARDLAVWRGQQAACPVVLGSATPSLESWHKAQSGAYVLLSLSRRAHEAAVLPLVEVLDVRRLRLEQGFSEPALRLLQENFRRGGMSLVYLNRRGFSPALFCGDCGHTFGCLRCSAKMVLHQRSGELRCHHCDWRTAVPRACPDCGNQDLTAIGHGTQRVEETLRRLLPQARIERVDRDSTAHQGDWDALYGRIAAHEVDVLVGTQMLAKGHDFARLNLVVVLNADGSLYGADFRAPERLFAELMQVSGRAGRADAQGKVLIQTQLPEHAVFAAVRAQDFRRFADAELAERKLFGMPPFGFQAAIRADAPLLQDAVALLADIRIQLEPLLPEGVSQLGPVPMSMVRLAGRERAQLFLESLSRRDLHQAAARWVQLLQQHKGHALRWSVDIDPQEM